MSQGTFQVLISHKRLMANVVGSVDTGDPSPSLKKVLLGSVLESQSEVGWKGQLD